MSFARSSDTHKRRGRTNVAIALCLVGFMILLMALSLVQLRNTGPTEGFDHIVRPALEGRVDP